MSAALAGSVCLDVATVGFNALCVNNCGAGAGSDCKTVCDYFGVPYVSPNQCNNAGAVKDLTGKNIVGNVVCKLKFPLASKTCCRCDKFA